MLSRQVRARLANTSRIRRAAPAQSASATAEQWHDLSHRTPQPACDLARGDEVSNSVGHHWIITESLESLWPACRKTLAKYEPQLEHFRIGEDVHPDLAILARRFPTATAFLDIETCGLGSAMVFLVGVIRQCQDQLVLTQLWARNYAEEAAMLESLRSLLQTQSVLVTFNGKSFDWPVIRDRMTMHTRGQPAGLPELAHVDLLHHSRRRWKEVLPNCKLQTLERHLCGRHRNGDIPGSEIPDVYHDYVRSGDATEVRSILHHNALDLITLLQLSLQILE